MRPDEILASEPVTFDAVVVGDWIVPVWPYGPAWPPMRVQDVGYPEDRVLVCESVIAPTIGPSRPHVHIVDRDVWERQGASRFQWLRLPGLRKLEELAGSGLLVARRA